jgi:hypothetical protein
MELVPRVTPVPHALIFDVTLSAALFLTFVRLYASAWRSNYLHTEPLKFERLLLLLNLKRAQLHAHLRMLRMAKLLIWTVQADGHYVIHFLTTGPPESDKSESGVGLISLSQEKDSQTTPSGSKKPDSPPELVIDPVVEEAAGYLMRAGVWSDRAWRIAHQVAENERQGQPYLPTRADVLGWIAYCYSGQQRNQIKLPAAALAANLSANRRCPEAYRPPRVCAACGFEEGQCCCHGDPHYQFPKDFLQQALSEAPTRDPVNSWGVCPECHCSPCQCEE